MKFLNRNLSKNCISKKRTLHSLFFLLFFLFLNFSLSSCASTEKWNASWPTYNEPISTNASVALIGRGDVFTLMRAKWFSNRLSIPMENIYPFFENLSDSLIIQTLEKSYPNLKVFPKKFNQNFPEETQKLDDKIFIRGHFPAQGKEVSLPDSAKPKYLILIHEITLGTDLNKSAFFDYSKKQEEIDQKKKPEQISVILSFTLWDNQQQVPLYSAITEEQEFISNNVSLDSIKNLLHKAIAKIPQVFAKGASR